MDVVIVIAVIAGLAWGLDRGLHRLVGGVPAANERERSRKRAKQRRVERHREDVRERVDRAERRPAEGGRVSVVALSDEDGRLTEAAPSPAGTLAHAEEAER